MKNVHHSKANSQQKNFSVVWTQRRRDIDDMFFDLKLTTAQATYILKFQELRLSNMNVVNNSVWGAAASKALSYGTKFRCSVAALLALQLAIKIS